MAAKKQKHGSKLSAAEEEMLSSNWISTFIVTRLLVKRDLVNLQELLAEFELFEKDFGHPPMRDSSLFASRMLRANLLLLERKFSFVELAEMVLGYKEFPPTAQPKIDGDEDEEKKS